MHRPTERDEGPEFLGPGYDMAAFRSDLSGGRLRWLATILATASGVLLGCMAAGIAPMEIHYPIHLKGRAAPWAVVGALLTWGWLALLNWSNWSKRSGREGGGRSNGSRHRD